MRTVSIIGAVYVAAVLLALSAGAAEPVKGVSGRVVDEAGAAVPHAEVALYVRHADGTESRSSEADAAGDFMIPEVKQGRVMAFARAADGRVGLTSIVHTTERPAEGVTVIVSTPRTLRLRVLDPDGRPLAGAVAASVGMIGPNGEVWLRRDTAEAFDLTWPESDADGLLEIDGLPATGAITAEVAHPEFVRGEIEDVPPDATEPPAVRLSHGGRFIVSIRGEGVEIPREGMTIRLYREGEFPHLADEPFTPEADGRAKFVVPVGTWGGFVRCPGLQALPAHLEKIAVTAEEPAAVEVVLTPRGLVRGLVLDEAGEPVPDCLVSSAVHSDLHGSDPFGYGPGWHFSAHAWTDDEGHYEITPGVGRVRLWVEESGKWTEPAQIEVDVPRDEPVKVEPFHILPPPKLTGRVIDPDGRPVPHAIVKPAGEQRWLLSTLADTDGRFEYVVEGFDQPDRAEPVGTLSLRVFDPRRPLEAELTVPIDVRTPAEAFTIRLEPTAIAPPPGVERPPRFIAVSPGETAPELTGRRTLNADGPIRLSDFRGEFVLLDFWTVWCGPCRLHKPEVEAAARLYGDRLVVIGIHDNSVPPEKVAADVEENGPSFPTVIDTADDETIRRYGVEAFPTYVLIGPDGRILLTSQHSWEAMRADFLSTLRSFLYGPPGRRPVEAAKP